MLKQGNGTTPTREINMIAQGAVFEGTLRVDGDVRVSGRVEGQLRVQGRTIVAPEGTVAGDVTATEAEVAGTVDGKLHIEKRLILRSGAKVLGDIEAGQLVIEEGAHFDGECRMGTSKGASKKVLRTEELSKEAGRVGYGASKADAA